MGGDVQQTIAEEAETDDAKNQDAAANASPVSRPPRSGWARGTVERETHASAVMGTSSRSAVMGTSETHASAVMGTSSRSAVMGTSETHASANAKTAALPPPPAALSGSSKDLSKSKDSIPKPIV
jgi:hypothetical protein